MRLVVRLVVSVLVLSLVGCGRLQGVTSGSQADGGPSPTSASPTVSATPTPLIPSGYVLWKNAESALASATSLDITVRLTKGTNVTVHEVVGTRDGSNSKQIGVVSNLNSEILVVGDRFFMKGDPEFMKTMGMPDSLIQRLGGRYLSVPASKMTPPFTAKDISLGQLLSDLRPLEVEDASARWSVETTVLSGVPAYLVTMTSGKDAGRLWVSADSKTNPLKFVADDSATPSPTGPTSVEISFQDWNAVQPWPAPPADQVLAI